MTTQFNPTGTNMDRLRRGANWLVCSSVILGAVLLVQLYLMMVPYWLLYSILAGWTLYLIIAIALAKGREQAYPAALALSIVTLAVSLPQPEHLSLAESGPTLASLTFIVGSALQIGVIIFIALILLEKRHFGAKALP